MAEVLWKELDVKESEITYTVVEDTCFVKIPEEDYGVWYHIPWSAPARASVGI